MEKYKDKSKFLSMLLRHKPETLELDMDNNGWVSISQILEKTDWKPRHILEIVKSDAKSRYEISGDKIRAVQGHTIEVELDLEKVVPPGVLYHGTKILSANKIIHHGIKKMKRHHVHLSDKEETAREVGQRHKLPDIVFAIDTHMMTKNGCQFYVSKNNVFLVDYVSPKYLINGIWINKQRESKYDYN